MSSSISSSELPAWDSWARWLAFYLATLAGATAALYVFIVISDPFSTGRFTPLQTIDIAYSGRTHANAGRVRDLAFDSAIIGNSVSTRFEPEQLNGPTNRRIVQLSIPGLGPNDELTTARAFVRAHGKHTKTLIFMIEHLWCVTDDRQLHRYPQFPNWLYETDDLAYLREIFSLPAAQAAFHRAAIRLGFAPEAGRRDGFVPHDQRGTWGPERVVRLASAKRPTEGPPKPWKFPALDRLQDFGRAIDPAVEMVLLVVPFHVSALPVPGSDAHAWIDACKTQLRAIAESRPKTFLIDRMRDDETTRDANNFWDATHVRDHILRALEADIVNVLRPR